MMGPFAAWRRVFTGAGAVAFAFGFGFLISTQSPSASRRSPLGQDLATQVPFRKLWRGEHTIGQTRALLPLRASRNSALGRSGGSSRAWRAKSLTAREVAGPTHLRSTAPVKQPTRFSSCWIAATTAGPAGATAAERDGSAVADSEGTAATRGGGGAGTGACAVAAA